jgi:hypothetical protein
MVSKHKRRVKTAVSLLVIFCKIKKNAEGMYSDGVLSMYVRLNINLLHKYPNLPQLVDEGIA